MTTLLLGLLAVASPPADTVPLFEGLGDHHHEISTPSARTQAYFDQGFRLLYGFNHEAAIRSFETAMESDPNCAMCYWGVALAAGPNINAAMDEAGGVRAHDAIRAAQARSAFASEKERAYIDALATRYGKKPMAHRAQRDSAYARSMRDVAAAYPMDPDAQVLYADAIMNLAPWDYWTEELTPRPGTNELLARLEKVTMTRPDHAGACHLYIHAVEKADPFKAVPCADRLPALMPSAGHIVHMPAHIYIRVGRYVDAIELNHHATHADERYIHAEKPRGLYPMAYYPHNYDFLAFAAAMAGRSAEALDAARKGADAVDTDMMQIPELGGLQNYYVLPLRMMVRFGMWDDILATPELDTALDYPVGFWHFAHGMARLRRGDVEKANAHLAEVKTRAASESIQPHYIWWNPSSAILRLGVLTLEAEIAMERGDLERAVRSLEEAIDVEDDLTYDEPPAWTVPPRQVLGRILLEVGRAAHAQRVFEEDLERHPENGWSLLGLVQALEAQDKAEAAAEARARFGDAWATADHSPAGATF